MTICHLGNCIGGHSYSRGSLSSTSFRKGTHTKAYKLLVKPYPTQVLWLYGKVGMVSHPNPTISFYQSQGTCLIQYHLQFIVFPTHVKPFQYNDSSFQDFHNHFLQVFPFIVTKISLALSSINEGVTIEGGNQV